MLEIIAGVMEAGKTWLLYKRISDAKLMGKKVQVFAYPVHDGHVVSRIGFKSEAITVQTVAEIESALAPDVNVIAIDDAQLFEKGDMLNFCRRHRRTKHVIIAGLQTDCFGDDFGAVVELMGRSELVTVLLAVCEKCKQQKAIFSQRFRDLQHTEPISKEDPRIELRKEYYAPVCWNCFVPPK